MKIIRKTILTGIAGTLATDAWTLLLKMFGVHSHGLLLVGQWIVSHLNPASQSQLMGKALFVAGLHTIAWEFYLPFCPTSCMEKTGCKNPHCRWR